MNIMAQVADLSKMDLTRIGKHIGSNIVTMEVDDLAVLDRDPNILSYELDDDHYVTAEYIE